jgi:hypothetical protein
MITLKFKIGKGMIEYQSNDIKSIHKFSSVYGALPRKCDNCKSEDLYLSHKSPKGNDYYFIICKDCNAELIIHQKKEGGYYLKWGEKMEKYLPQKNNENDEDDNIKVIKKSFPNAEKINDNIKESVPF